MTYNIVNLVMTGPGNDIPHTISAGVHTIIIYIPVNTQMNQTAAGGAAIVGETPTIEIEIQGQNLPGTILHFSGVATNVVTILELSNQD